MALLSGDARRVNATFLLVLAAIILRLWYEAVIWRIEQGPQMLGFQVMHFAAGGDFRTVLAPLLFFSFLAVYAYFLWAIWLGMSWLIPRKRKNLSNAHTAVIGVSCYVGYGATANTLQAEGLSQGVLLSGAALLTVFVFIFGWLIYFGFRKEGENPKNGI